MEIYITQKGTYPVTATTVCSNNGAALWIPGLNTNYMTSIPVDPINSPTGNSYNATGYTYCYYSGATAATQGTFFMLTTLLESPNATDLTSKCTNSDGSWGSSNSGASTGTYPRNLFICNQQ